MGCTKTFDAPDPNIIEVLLQKDGWPEDLIRLLTAAWSRYEICFLGSPRSYYQIRFSCEATKKSEQHEREA